MTQMSSSMIKPTVTPKGVNRLGAVFCDTVRRYRTPYILYWIAMVIFGPLAAIIDCVNTFGNPNLLPASSSYVSSETASSRKHCPDSQI